MAPMRSCASLATLAVALVLLTAPASAEAKRCLGSRGSRSLGPTYVLQITVTHTSCETGKRVVRAYDRCRRRHGGAKGRCPSRVLHYRCTEGRRRTSPVQFDAPVSCRYGARRVKFTYTQNT